jgi:LPXTG-motif cell wall-anchored protein
LLSNQSGEMQMSGTTRRVNRGGRSLKLMAASIGLLLLITGSFGNAFASMPVAPLAATAPTLGNAQSFAVLGGSAVTNTGASVITGDLGVSPGTSVTGFPPGNVIGTIHSADTLAGQAQAGVTTAYNALAAQTCTTTFTPPTDLGGKTLVPGVYCFGSSAALTGVLTLDGQGNPSAVWVFKIGSAITAASGSSIVFIGAGSGCNVFWQVTSSATIGTTSQFAGNILALTSITLNTGARLSGRALARNGAVTLDTNTISASACLPSSGATAGTAATATAAAALLTGTPVGTASATPTRSAAAATAAASSTVPKGLPRTGDSPTWSGLFGLLFGALLVLMGVGIFRRSHR